MAGAYLVEEVSPPDGYRLSGTAVQAFEILGQQSSSGGDPEYQLVTLTFTNDRIPGEFKVKKVDEVGTTLAGVTFELFADRNSNNVIDKAESLGRKKTGIDGNPLTWGDLPWGTDYKVLEVSHPAGYTPKGDALTGPYVIDRGNSVTVTRVNNRIDIPTLDKSSEPAEPQAVETGQLISYTITVKNEGALPLTNQTLVDVLPAAVALDQATVKPTGDTSAPGRIVWRFDLGAFSSTELHLLGESDCRLRLAEPLRTPPHGWRRASRTRPSIRSGRSQYRPHRSVSRMLRTTRCELTPRTWLTGTRRSRFGGIRPMPRELPINASGQPTTDPTPSRPRLRPRNTCCDPLCR